MIWNPGAETMTASERRSLQLGRLRETVRWTVERVAVMGARLGAPDIRSLDDLQALPFTRKTDLREHYPFGLFAVPKNELVRIHASSGTKGKPTVVGYTAADLDVWREVMARLMVAAGARPGHTLHNAYGYGLFTGGLGFHDGGERIGMTVVPVSSGNTARHQMLLQDFRPDGLGATPSFALHIGESLLAAGGRPDTLGLKYGMFGAEPWTEGLRRALERVWGCPAYDVYGLSEIIGPGVAGECEAREGLHVADDHFLPEIVDPVTGASRGGEGEEGELVLTTLTKRALPMLRYRTGDITALTTEPCRCGRTSARIARLKGRADDMLVIKGVNVYPSEVEAALLTIAEIEPHYQLVVDRRETLARVEVHVEPAAPLLARCGGFAERHPDLDALRGRIADCVRGAIGLGVDVHLVRPQTIPRSEGKAVRVIHRDP